VVGDQFLLDASCKEKLTQIQWQMADFCGVEVITHCMMSNHFHVLIRVPATNEPDDTELLRRMEVIYGGNGAEVKLAREGIQKQGHIDEKLRRQMVRRMGEVSVFMKEFKQRFSRWYNGRNGRRGTLWAQRYDSVLVEDSVERVETTAAYIDLNPVRAGMVEDPKDYRFCGYGMAMGGDERSRKGLKSILKNREWDEVSAQYRMYLFTKGGVSGNSGKVALEREKILEVIKAGGKVSVAVVLRLRLRHMTAGLVLGSREFVNEVFLKHRDKFGGNRKDGARRLRGVPLEGMMAMRDLQVDVMH
jgi:REP element-mobilizing transposase RayT